MDQYIVHVDCDMSSGNQIFEQVVHHGLEGGWGICETEKHDQWFKGSFGCFENRLPLVSFFDPYVVIPPSHIQLGVQLRWSCGVHVKSVKQFIDKGERVVVASGVFIQFSVINNWSFATILLGDVKDGTRVL